MGHHWREPHPVREEAPRAAHRPLAEFLGLLRSVIRPEGLRGEWMPFDPSPSSFKYFSGRRNPHKADGS